MTHPASALKAKAKAESIESQASQPAAPITDGRINRSIVTRKKIVDALSGLIREGVLSPTAEQVASRADIGLRTVFRHFEDMENLYREITPQIEQLVMPVVNSPLVGEHWKDRLRESVRIRASLYEQIAAYQLASQALRHQSAYLHEQLMAGAALHRRVLAHNLPPALRSDRVALEGLDLATSIDTWIRLRREQSLSAALALDVVQHLVAGLIAGTE